MGVSDAHEYFLDEMDKMCYSHLSAYENKKYPKWFWTFIQTFLLCWSYVVYKQILKLYEL